MQLSAPSIPDDPYYFTICWEFSYPNRPVSSKILLSSSISVRLFFISGISIFSEAYCGKVFIFTTGELFKVE